MRCSPSPLTFLQNIVSTVYQCFEDILRKQKRFCGFPQVWPGVKAEITCLGIDILICL